MSCNCSYLLQSGRIKRCGVGCCGDLLCHFIDALEGDVNGEKIFDGDFFELVLIVTVIIGIMI